MLSLTFQYQHKRYHGGEVSRRACDSCNTSCTPPVLQLEQQIQISPVHKSNNCEISSALEQRIQISRGYIYPVPKSNKSNSEIPRQIQPWHFSEIMNPLFLLSFLSFLIHVSTEDAPRCELKKFPRQSPRVEKAARNCSREGSSWRGLMKTFQSREGVTLRWQNLLHNPKCVNSLRISLSDGEHVKHLERSGPSLQQKRIEIPYSHTKCRSHPLSLTVKVESNNGTCFVALQLLTFELRLNETQRQECLRKVRIQKEAEEREK